ncbi:pilus assembly protein [Vibrio sp. S4M6]|uniref:TadE/TadG family type IV pilus assembly protein n=1 Tax=Vibrio sinus TaxID=2946865 RepID=UPI00202A2A60|nr:TadE family protein [Vibrio sinus]MCL9783356.1 pilus assembly protein [Vibrio sinus]
MKRVKFNIRGVVTIEFTLGFLCLWLLMMAWLEVSYLSYVSSVTDLIITQAVRRAKVTEDSSNNYLATIENVIRSSGSQWGHVIDPANFKITIQYASSINDLESKKNICSSPADPKCGGAAGSAIAIYHVNYELFNTVTKLFNTKPLVLSREMIVIQEYQRDKFPF